MRTSEEKYISLLTDFGFKRIFGSQPNKDLLISFLNSLFKGEQVIKDVQFRNSEHVGDVYAERKAIFDVYCENEKGEKFIVEMQNARQKYFKDRSLYYATFPIREQAEKGENWDFQLKHVYIVALINYEMNEEAFDPNSISHDIALTDIDTHRIFSHTLSFKYVEIAKFNKTADELETLYDKWIFVLKNLARLDNQPLSLQTAVFNRLFSEAEIARFNKEDIKEYEDSLKAYRDIQNSIDTAKEEGFARGMAKGIEQGIEQGIAKGEQKIVQAMIQQGCDVDFISKVTGISTDTITTYLERQ